VFYLNKFCVFVYVPTVRCCENRSRSKLLHDSDLMKDSLFSVPNNTLTYNIFLFLIISYLTLASTKPKCRGITCIIACALPLAFELST